MPVPASLVTYEFNDDKRPTDPTLPQNRPDRVEEPLPPESAKSMASDQQASLNEEGLEDMSPIGYLPLKVSPCANIVHTTVGGTTQNCHQDGTMSCGKCHLVRVSGPPTNLVPAFTYPNKDQIALRWLPIMPRTQTSLPYEASTDMFLVLQQRLSNQALVRTQERLQFSSTKGYVAAGVGHRTPAAFIHRYRWTSAGGLGPIELSLGEHACHRRSQSKQERRAEF